MSEKKLQDYLHYYIGCQMMYSSHHEPQNEPYVLTFKNIEEAIEFGDRPILRRLEDITDEEDQEYHKLLLTKELDDYSIRHDCPESFHYLLKRGFDLFDLIDSGVAADAKLIKINSL